MTPSPSLRVQAIRRSDQLLINTTGEKCLDSHKFHETKPPQQLDQAKGRLQQTHYSINGLILIFNSEL
jgi:hypothetical protein